MIPWELDGIEVYRPWFGNFGSLLVGLSCEERKRRGFRDIEVVVTVARVRIMACINLMSTDGPSYLPALPLFDLFGLPACSRLPSR
jgi:hypothetical protein